MNERENYLFKHLEKLIFSFNAGQFENMYRTSNKGKSPVQLSTTFEESIMPIYETQIIDKKDFGLTSIKDYKPDTLTSVFDTIRKQLTGQHGGNGIIPLKTIKDYINTRVHNITPI